MSKLAIRVTSLLALLLLLGVDSARAQRGLSPYIGFGSAKDTVGTDAADNCTTGQLFDGFTGFCENGPVMGGLFGTVGADYMFKRHYGFNGEYSTKVGDVVYLPNGGLKMRPSFYDLNFLWEPRSGADARFIPYINSGFGGARISLYFNPSEAVTGLTAPTTPFFHSDNYLQWHTAFGMKVYIRRALFVKPEFDLHYVINLNNQFGRNLVIQYAIAVGYTFGAR